MGRNWCTLTPRARSNLLPNASLGADCAGSAFPSLTLLEGLLAGATGVEFFFSFEHKAPGCEKIKVPTMRTSSEYPIRR